MAWSSQQYVKFEDERTRPARDLLAQVPLTTLGTAFDLGCGPGNSTQLIAERFPQARVAGIDSDENMLEAAAKRLPGISFTRADLGDWMPAEPADLIFANAVFQWLPNHLDLFGRLMGGLAPGGVLAVQMPDNLTEPSHMLMEEALHAGLWGAPYAGRSLRRTPLPSPSVYYDRLIAASARVDIWHTIYNHPLADAQAIVEWVKATGLRPYLDAIRPEERAAFLAVYLEKITGAYPPLSDGRVLLRFPRLFIVAVKK